MWRCRNTNTRITGIRDTVATANMAPQLVTEVGSANRRSAYALFQSTSARKDSEEIVLALVEFDSGAIGSVADSVCGIRNHYTRIIGSKASLVMTGENEQTVCRLQREGKAEPELLAVRDQKRPGGGLDHFFDCIREGKKSPNSLAGARHSLAAALAMRESARTKKPVPVA